MPCEPFTIDLEVDPPDDNTDITFDLEKICNADDTVEWKLHFELANKNADGTLTSVVKLDIDVNHEDAGTAAATATHGLDAPQRAQANVTALTAAGVQTGDATQSDVQPQAAAVIPARDPASPK